MATKTTNYGLTKPEGSDFYDVGVQNDNMDLIDKQMKANADGIAQLNSETTWSGTRGTVLKKVGKVVFCTISQKLDNAVANHVYTNVFLDAIPEAYRPASNVHGSFAVVAGGYYIGNGYINVKTNGDNEAILSASRGDYAEYNISLVWCTK